MIHGLAKGLTHAEAFAHLGVKESPSGTVGLHPLSIDDELGYGAFTDVAEKFLGCPRRPFDVDLGVGDLV